MGCRGRRRAAINTDKQYMRIDRDKKLICKIGERYGEIPITILNHAMVVTTTTGVSLGFSLVVTRWS